MDLYNREIVAYTISECQDTDFVLDTLNQLELPQDVYKRQSQNHQNKDISNHVHTLNIILKDHI